MAICSVCCLREEKGSKPQPFTVTISALVRCRIRETSRIREDERRRDLTQCSADSIPALKTFSRSGYLAESNATALAGTGVSLSAESFCYAARQL